MNAKLIPFLLLFSAILCLNASAAPFAVTQPDGIADTTSGYYTVVWTPMGPEYKAQSMIKDLNTISCWADPNTGTDSNLMTYPLFSRRNCCDLNSGVSQSVYVGNLPGRNGGRYYVWCRNDLNANMMAYSSGQFTLTRFGAGDFFGLSIDSVGGLIAAIARTIGPVALIIVVIIVVVLVTDLLTGIFGIFDYLKRLAH